jgi:hypothetical protein
MNEAELMLHYIPMSNYARILSEARELLTEEERRKLSLELVPDERGVDPEIEMAWMAEAKRRFEELDKGLVKAIPWDEARKRLFENR